MGALVRAMPDTDIILRTAVSPFPPGYCPTTNQQFADDIAAAVEQRDRIWAKVDDSTGVIIGFYTWNTVVGQWVKNHWPLGVIPTNERRIFIGSLLALESYDGGESGTISQSTGSFWVQDTAFTDKWPLGVGTLIAAPLSTLSVFDDAVPGVPDAIGVYVIKPSSRLWDRAV